LEIEKLKKQVEELQTYIKVMTTLNNEQLIKQSIEEFKKQGFKETFFGDRENIYLSHETDKSKNFSVKRGDAQAMLTKLAEFEQQKQKEEYQELLESNNGNNNH
jgi:hypothetical protein